MNIEELREYCLSRPGATEDFPFDETTLAFKVGGKIFALTSLDAQPLTVNLKCDPEWAVTLREQFSEVQPGYHMNKKHWNTVVLEGNVKISDVKAWVDHSYDLVLRSLPKATRQSVQLQV